MDFIVYGGYVWCRSRVFCRKNVVGVFYSEKELCELNTWLRRGKVGR